MSEAIDLGEIAAREDSDDVVTAKEFTDTIQDMDRAMVRSGHFPGAASTYALIALASAEHERAGAEGPNMLLAVLADTAQFVKDHR